MNCLLLCEGRVGIVVDCGVTFDDRGLGVDVIRPAFEALDDVEIAGIVLTHGHEDHIGAVPHLLARHDVPVWGPRYTLGLLDARSDEHEILQHAELYEAIPRSRFKVGPFTVEPIKVTHSTVDATALSIEGPSGRVIHTGDFKFDDDAAIGEVFDVERLEELGRDGVDLLMSDSTNVDVKVPGALESDVRATVERLVKEARGAVVVSLFSSNVRRLEALGRIAERTGRKLVLLGRSVATHSKVARRQGRIAWKDELVWPADLAGSLEKNRILAVATGSQGEPQAALARLSRGEHPALTIGEGDTVILSSRAIPGHEPALQMLVADLIRRGVAVRSHHTDDNVHASGHASREEQRRMIALTQPKAFIPLHGTLHHLHRHAELAREAGIRDTIVLENGSSAHLDNGVLDRGAPFPTGRVFLYDHREVTPAVIGERRAMAENGAAFVAIRIGASGDLVAEPSIALRGVTMESRILELAARARVEIRLGLAELGPPRTDERIADVARLATRRAIARITGKKPVTSVTVERNG